MGVRVLSGSAQVASSDECVQRHENQKAKSGLFLPIFAYIKK
jgi:hypothetical protein